MKNQIKPSMHKNFNRSIFTLLHIKDVGPNSSIIKISRCDMIAKTRQLSTRDQIMYFTLV